MKIIDLIEPTILVDSDGSKIEDLIYIDSEADVEKIDSNERIVYPTDYAIMNFAWLVDEKTGPEKRRACRLWIRPTNTEDGDAIGVDELWHVAGPVGDIDANAIRPNMRLNIQKFISARNMMSDVLRIDEYKVDGQVKYHTIDLGEYPKRYFSDGYILDDAERWEILPKTGKKYMGCFAPPRYDKDPRHNVKPTINDEYIIDNQKFVHVIHRRRFNYCEFLCGIKMPHNNDVWARVEPITWRIKNWDDLPKEINPEGSGEAQAIEIQTLEAINCGIPYYPMARFKDGVGWDDSIVRGYLNGLNVLNDKNREEFRRIKPSWLDFTQNNFLEEALSGEIQPTSAKLDEDAEWWRDFNFVHLVRDAINKHIQEREETKCFNERMNGKTSGSLEDDASPSM